MRNIILLILLFSVFNTFAENAVIANCSEGKGCTFELSDFDKDLFSQDFDRPLESGDIIVYGKKKNGKEVLYLDKKSRAAIDKEWGGDGFTQLGLFNPQIQPTDGLWKVTYGASTGNDCYGIGNIGTFYRGKISPGMAGNGNIQFQKPFNPSQLFPSNDMRWVKTGFSTYKGSLDFGNGASSPMKMFYNIKIVSTTKIETYYTVEIKVPTKPKCVAQIPVTFTLIKEKTNKEPYDYEKSDDENLDDDLLPVNPKGNKDDLMEVKPKDELLPVNPSKNNKPNVPILEDNPKPNVPRIE